MDVFRIGDGRMQTRPDDEIGAKAANLARMAALGLPVPPAFVVPISVCAAVAGANGEAEQRLIEVLQDGIAYLESATGKTFGDRRRPLLVSVRSGAAKSMPGMLDTVLNVGCTPAAARGLVRITGNPGICLGLPAALSRKLCANRTQSRSGAICGDDRRHRQGREPLPATANSMRTIASTSLCPTN